MAKRAIDAGAQFIVSPNQDEEVLTCGAKNNIDVYPGVMTPTEIVRAVKAGARTVKIFLTGSLGGAAFIKEIRAPLNDVPMIASGSVGLHNIRDILQAGAFAVGIGGSLVNRHWIEEGNYDAIRNLAQELVHTVADLREVR
ncbi:bifunctional 4-hydroxy-2-oxoglutarate aldolase/2-dehydro-3-deoxy-phosphogluconate aldolase [Paenibacillus sp. NPDC056579]|uniref:bifunctional 4-hydroxy-2-oxoglutarate aldolase/2-dehydro-3-deoxy-phosphogluconate aldolase n=1 Tax=Paenibacillus sp. NPDC056579 TaxID=3345871 RepID=UPI0036BBF58E